jgi:hypothetical protein
MNVFDQPWPCNRNTELLQKVSGLPAKNVGGHTKALGDERKRNGQQDTQRLVWEVEVTLRGIVEPIHNAVTLAELAVQKGAKALLLPASSRRQLFDLSDAMATKVDIEFYQDGRDALMKSLAD